MRIDDLDKMIDYLKGKNNYTKFKDIVKDNPDLDCDPIIIKLEKDGYINSGTSTDSQIKFKKELDTGTIYDVTEKIISEDNVYKLSFEGFMLKETGGYSKLEKRKSNAAILQFWQTWAIVVGTLFAGLYGLYELIKEIPKLCKMIF